MIKISVITPTLNSANSIARLINSLNIFSILGIAWELVIVDGGSTDATVDIVRSFKCNLKLISEVDGGIYDAMNKGIKISSGDWLLFIGSDDYLNIKIDGMKLKKSFKVAKINRFDFISFTSVRDYGYKQERLTAKPRLLPFTNSIPHPSTFIRKNTAIKGYSLKYKIASDYEFFLKKFINGSKFLVIDEILTVHSYGGTSSDIEKSQNEVKAIQKRILPGPAYFIVSSLTIIRKKVKKICQ
jgi:glycosyltransferase involved in cell wall biosynthesis